MINNNNNNKL